MDKRRKVLVVEDDPVIGRGLLDLLVFHGFDAELAVDGESGLRAGLNLEIDLVLLDLTLPHRDGLDVCQKLRAARPELAILILTSRCEEHEVVAGLAAGADDYVGKPASAQEIVLRVRAILRRSGRSTDYPATITLGALTIFPALRRGERRDDRGVEEIAFGEREIDLLVYLVNHPERPVSRGELLVGVWGYRRSSRLETRTVDIHIAKLRRKIEPDPDNPRYLLTHRGAGYLLDRDGAERMKKSA